MLILANRFRLGSKLGRQAKSGVPGLHAEYLTISNIFQRVTRAKRIWPEHSEFETGKIETLDMLRNPYQQI
jgi:hypothetical protein